MVRLEFFAVVFLSMVLFVEPKPRILSRIRSVQVRSNLLTMGETCPAGYIPSKKFTMSYDFECVSCGQTCCRNRRRRSAWDEELVDKRIRYGQPAVRGQFPWSVAIFKKIGPREWIYICGGVLLSEKVIGTAAHCVDDKNIENLSVTVGEVDIMIDKKGTRKTEGLDKLKSIRKKWVRKKSMPHPEDQWTARHIRRFDFALLYLERKVTNPRICLRRRERPQKKPVCFGVGHGMNQSGHRSSHLQWTKIELDYDNNCLLGRLHNSGNMLCASWNRTTVNCRLDSGSPVFCRLERDVRCSSYYLAGIFSFNHEPENERCEGEFTVLADLTTTKNSALSHEAATASTHDDIQESYAFDEGKALCSSMTTEY